MALAPLDQLKQEAAGLAAQLGSLSTQTRAASTGQIGSAARRRVGTGENFWQYRQHTAEDGAQRIDWRRSAKGDRLYMRETELETARTYLFWTDASDGFQWSSKDNIPTKADRALVLCMALAGALSRAGERCGALGLGRSPVSGARAPTRVGEDLRAQLSSTPFPAPPRERAAAVVCSDFYTPLDEWRRRLSPLKEKCREGVLLQVTDPMEETFPFDGRTNFNRPGSDKTRIVGRAESIRDDYLALIAQRRADLDGLAAEMGWRFVSHITTEPANVALNRLAYVFANVGATA